MHLNRWLISSLATNVLLLVALSVVWVRSGRGYVLVTRVVARAIRSSFAR